MSNRSNEAIFGTRTLGEDDDVYSFNAWDNVEWNSARLAEAERIVAQQKDNSTPESNIEFMQGNAANYWNKFYARNQNRFFKDRRWLPIEFPELFIHTENKYNVLEIGCGAGNTIFPLLSSDNPNLHVYGCDYSQEAINVVKTNPLYSSSSCTAFVWDITAKSIPDEISPESMDVIILVFVLSALLPSEWLMAVNNIYRILKPGGIVLFRDYGRYDLTQLRFRPQRLLQDNLYVRGDGTRVYFFTSDEISELFSSRFDILQNSIDKRLIVNRARQVQMFRVWLQAKFIKKPAGGINHV